MDAAAVSIGRVHDVFVNRVADLKTQAAAQAAAARGATPRPWNLPAGDWPGDPGVLADVVIPFDQDPIGVNYEQALNPPKGTPPGTVGDVVALNAQASYLTTLERAFRARFCSPPRLAAMTTARRTGHGADGGIFDRPAQYVAAAIADGSGVRS